MLVFVASMLDPRNRFQYVDAVLKIMYGAEQGSNLSAKVKESFFELFNEYKRIYFPSMDASSSPTSSHLRAGGEMSKFSDDHCDDESDEELSFELEKTKSEYGLQDSKSEFDNYLCENNDIGNKDPNFSILNWWKINALRFRFYV